MLPHSKLPNLLLLGLMEACFLSGHGFWHPSRVQQTTNNFFSLLCVLHLWKNYKIWLDGLSTASDTLFSSNGIESDPDSSQVVDHIVIQPNIIYHRGLISQANT